METMDSIETQIAQNRFLAGLNPRFYHYFGECATQQTAETDQEVFHEGNPADRFYFIQSGKVALETFVPGLGRVMIESLGPGDALGWSWLFPPHQWHFTASPIEPTELIAFDAASLRNRAEENRDFGNQLLTRVSKMLLDRLLGTRTQLVDLYGMRP
jgi:CRP-like cAMP-binding protein